MDIEEIRKLAVAIEKLESLEASITYILERIDVEPGSDDINRAGCSPIGVSEDHWPLYKGKKMYHVVTLDLESVPLVKKRFRAEHRAVALFISDLVNHDAAAPGNEHTKIIFLNSIDIGKGVSAINPPYDEDYREPEPCTFKCHEISLPKIIFDPDFSELEHPDGFDSPIWELYEAITSMQFAGGKPIWVQNNEYDSKTYNEELILQFGDDFVDMNTGDAGFMYVFKDTAFIQSH